MKKVAREEIKLVGITARTSLNEEMNPLTAKIGPTLQKYFGGGMPDQIKHKKNPGITFCAYTNYESDFMGEYTYFVGEEVTSFDDMAEGLQAMTIPAQQYAKFTSESGSMPLVCIDLWRKIWALKDENYGGESERAYIADFEIYDQRSQKPLSTVLDIYIGVKT